MAFTSWCREAIEESARFTKVGRYLKLQILLLIQILLEVLVNDRETRIELLDPIIQSKVLLLDEADLEE